MKPAKKNSRTGKPPRKGSKSGGTPPPPRPADALVAALCRALDEKKAEDLRVLDVGECSSITDYMILATANSETHLRALRIEVERVLKEAHTHLVGEDAMQESGWVVVDAFDVMIHLFAAEKRQFFGLENLWRDAREVPVAKLLAPPAAKGRQRAN